ncbi:MAG: hypothetical protein QOF36_2549 [Microbacteriaceae bacterium]|jgi:hypothetical protein|nr:hypothetical protein [Microbacteriaceae bacterium]
MSAFFDLVLDTTGPAGVAGSINSGATYTTSRDVTLGPTTTDPDTTGYQIKIWGNVDAAFDADIQATEGASAWKTLSGSMAVRLSTGDGSKTLTWRIRDDVWNESSTATDSITLDTTVPVVTIDSGPTPGKISKQTGKRTSDTVWHADVDIQAYKVKVVPATNSIHSAGTQIPTTGGSANVTGGSVTAASTVTTTIDGADLETAAGADGTWHVKVFVQDLAGNWSV